MLNSIKWYFYLLLFAPIIGLISYNISIEYYAFHALSYLVLPVFLIFLLTRKNKIYIPGFLYFYIAYVLHIYVWKIYNGYYEANGLIKYLFSNYHIYALLLMIIIYNTNISPKTYKSFVKLIKITLLIALVGVLIQFFIPNWMTRPTGWEVAIGNIFIDRRSSIFTYVSDNEYGISILAFFSLIFSIQLFRKNIRWLILFSIIIGLYSVLTNTRYIMIGFILVLFQSLFDKDKSKKISSILYFAIVFGVIYYLLTDVLGVDLKQLGEQRLFHEDSIKETSRYGAYINFLQFFPEKPVFGTGVHLTDEIRAASQAIFSSQIHVGYLSHLVSYGLFGSFLLFSFWFGLARDLYRKAKLTKHYGSLFAFLVFLWFNVTAVNFKLMYMGLIFAFIFSQYYHRHYIFQAKLQQDQLHKNLY
ncbi:MAG: hypothetical protein K8S14_01240 [Actinomycetia bacterium]|nr:hypothetical protein [Actinomycetes bacterium]